MIVISDTTMWATDTPSICTSMRGPAEAEITVTGPVCDLHSGSFGGGSGPEADLADILGAPLVFVAVGLDADRIHAPNEYVDLSRLLRGAESVAYLWEELAGAGVSA